MKSRSGVSILIATGVILLAGLAWWIRSRIPPGPSSPGEDDAYRYQVAWLLKADRLDEAARLIETWTSGFPDDERAVLASAELAARQEQPARAIELYASVAASSADPARVWLRIAQIQEGMGQLETAIESCRRAASTPPAADEALLRLGDLLRIVGRLEEAAAVLEPLVETSPSALPARHALAAVRNGQGRFEDAVALLAPFVAQPSLPENAREHYAVALGELGRREEAAEVWVDLLAANPHHVEGYYRLGRLARRLKRPGLSRELLGRYEELMSYRDKLESARKLELSGRRVGAHIARAEAYAATQQVDLAVEQLHRVARSPSVDLDAALAVILSLMRFDLLGDAREAIEVLRATASLPAHIADAMAGRLAERAGDIQRASIAYERALTARPDYRPVLLALARIRLENDPGRRSADAEALARRAHEAGADAESAVLLGRLAFLGGDLEAAEERFGEALAAAKGARWRAEARLYLGRIELARSNVDGALRRIEEVTAEVPTMVDAWTAAAEALGALGDARAREATDRAAELKQLEKDLRATRRGLLGAGAERAPLYLRLAELAERGGSRARRIQYLRTAIAVDPRSVEAYRGLAAAYAEPGDVFLRMQALARLVALEPRDEDARRDLEEARASVRFGATTGPARK